jgi:hypothetical protein
VGRPADKLLSYCGIDVACEASRHRLIFEHRCDIAACPASLAVFNHDLQCEATILAGLGHCLVDIILLLQIHVVFHSYVMFSVRYTAAYLMLAALSLVLY